MRDNEFDTLVIFLFRNPARPEMHRFMRDADLVKLQAAIMDDEKWLTFEAITGDEPIRTAVVRGEDLLWVERAPLKPGEGQRMRAEMRQKFSPIPSGTGLRGDRK